MAETISSAESGAIPLTETMLTKKGVEELIATVRKGGITPKGSSAFASLPTPAEANLGWMYNVSDAFTTTADWVEGAGKKYPAGTNVYVCNPSGSTYKWDALPGEGLQLTTDTPQPNGTAAAGSATTAARADHVHAIDTSRAPTSHASSATTYGVGTGSNYGHLKLSDATDGTAAAASGGTAATPKAVSDALAAAKSHADSVKGDANVIEGIKIDGASSNLTPSSKVVTIPSGTTSAKGVVQLSDSTSSNDSTTAATSKAVKAAKDAADAAATAASGVGTRVGAIEAAATTLYTALNGLDASSMTSANTIKTLVSSLLSYVKAFAAAADNDSSTTYTAS